MASKIYYEPNTLEQLVERSDLIVIVQKADPYVVQNILPLKCPKSGKKIPYTQVLLGFSVGDEIKNTTGKSYVKKQILVHDADETARIDLHVRYECEGLSKSPIYARYATKFSFDKVDRGIIFLRVVDDDIYYTMGGAAESTGRKSEVLRLAAKKQPT